jgi:hypothetical protein
MHRYRHPIFGTRLIMPFVNVPEPTLMAPIEIPTDHLQSSGDIPSPHRRSCTSNMYMKATSQLFSVTLHRTQKKLQSTFIRFSRLALKHVFYSWLVITRLKERVRCCVEIWEDSESLGSNWTGSKEGEGGLKYCSTHRTDFFKRALFLMKFFKKRLHTCVGGCVMLYCFCHSGVLSFRDLLCLCL